MPCVNCTNTSNSSKTHQIMLPPQLLLNQYKPRNFRKGSPNHSCKSIEGRIFVAKQCDIQLGKSNKSNKRKAEIQYSNKVKSVTLWKCQTE